MTHILFNNYILCTHFSLSHDKICVVMRRIFKNKMSEVQSSNETYHETGKTRPNKAGSSGHGKYCCIPGCKSAVQDSNWKSTGISLFKVPSKQPDRSKWIKIIKKYRRKGGSDSFDPKQKNIYICEFHFKPDDIRVTLGCGRKKVITGRIPSVFENKTNVVKSKRKSPVKRKPVIEYSSESIIESDSSKKEADSVDISNEPPNLNEIEALKLELEKSKEKEQRLSTKCECLEIEAQQLQNHLFTYKNISQNKELFKKTTGLSLETFKILLSFLNPGEKMSNVKFYDSTNRLSEETNSKRDLTFLKSGRTPALNNEEQCFLYLSWLKNGFSLAHMAFLFQISIATVSRYIITWSNFCYFSLGSIPIWPTREQIDDSMPESFKRTYSSTRCIIDCTELYCQRPSSLATQSALYSHYKSHVTYKGLIGISPSGAITFISELFDGSISDKEFLQNQWNQGDSVMADRGFTIDEELKSLGVTLNIPSFLKGRDQLTSAEVKESQTIASVRIHVERAIQRVKRFNILRNEIPLTLHGSVNQIWTVCCLLCNFMPPLIQKE